MTAIVLRGDARQLPLPDGCVDLLVTSPPYFGLRSYTDGGEHYAGQIGSEATPAAYLDALWACTAEWARVLKPGGSMFINLGDKYDSGTTTARINPGTVKDGQGQGWYQHTPRVSLGRPKSLLGIPWRYAIGCTDRLGLILRAEIIWSKPNGLPESVTDRVRRAHEQVFHLVKQPRYYAAVDEIREPYEPDSAERKRRYGNNPGHDGLVALRATGAAQHGSNGRSTMGLGVAPANPLGKLPGSVWSIPSAPLTVPARLGVDHFAAFPPALVRPLVLGWSPPGICVACGEGRRPVVDKKLAGGHRAPNARDFRRLANKITGGKHWDVIEGHTEATILGHACSCTPYVETPMGARYVFANWNAPPTKPAVVLDPFSGTGTVPLVASAYGRIGIGADLSFDYCRLAQWRTSDRGEIARAMDVPKPPKQLDGQEALWA